jgi:hypothetical protein
VAFDGLARINDHGLPRVGAGVLSEVDEDFAEKARVETFIGLELHFDVASRA